MMNTNDYVNGLLIKNGRLINDRPNGITGIQQIANMKRAVDNDRKINTISEEVGVAENKKNLRQLEF